MGRSTRDPPDMSAEDREKLVQMAAEVYGRYSSGFDMRDLEARARELMEATYGPLLDPIRTLIRELELSPGEEVVSIAIRQVDGEIRIKSFL